MPDGWFAAGLVALLYIHRRYRGRHFGCQNSNIETPWLVVLFRKVKSATHTHPQELNCGYVGNDIVLFVLGAAVCVTMGDGFAI